MKSCLTVVQSRFFRTCKTTATFDLNFVWRYLLANNTSIKHINNEKKTIN